VYSRLLVAVAAVLTGLTLLLVAGHPPWSGSILMSLGSTGHGLHVGDIPVLGVWAAAMICCWRLWLVGRSRGR